MQDHAIDQFVTAERGRVRDWQQNPETGRLLYQTFNFATYSAGEPFEDLESPTDAGLHLVPEWHWTSAVLRLRGDDLRILIRVEPQEDGTATAAAYPVGACERCGATVAKGPAPSTSRAEVGAALLHGVPVGHACAGRLGG